MSAIVTTLHVIACVFLITVVLLQRGKGAQVGAVFGGGGGATMFGGRGAGNFLTKLTTGAATIFMVTSLSLSYLGLSGQDERLFEGGLEQPAAAEEESLFEEFGTVPADAGAETTPAAESAAGTLDEAAAGAAPDEAAAGAETAVAEAAAGAETAVAEADAALDDTASGIEGAVDGGAEALGADAQSETP
jgi:preprotein translocase subunit SecG